ncbi:flagellin N-terminal helical domain-containing protein [Anaeropeptidivorans aminofermentans]|jgi:flagellin|uniref:flagellin N-terminal helical domain-containing protein n=1 Tax=Anaeropeptidivorans aminofermentans TaxID=2934315 RepID=UPI002023EA86|nr:flagellin [Anaeropeptidivorans aminofermentans]
MRINTNIPALRAYNSIKSSDRKLSASMQKLSSGVSISSAKDDASGLAISNKMRMQIAGLEMASRNSMDGISLIQTADGALNEVHAMLQRMRELSVQASNGTYEGDDRQKVQDEINQLIAEIEDVSYKTEFNTLRLFGANKRVDFKTIGGEFSDGSIISSISKNFPQGNLQYTIENVGLPSEVALDFGSAGSISGTTFSIDGSVPLTYSTNDKTTAMNETVRYLNNLGYETEISGDSVIIRSTVSFPPSITADSSILETVTEPGTQTVITGISLTDKNGDPVSITASTSYQSLKITVNSIPPAELTIDLNIVKNSSGNPIIGGKNIDPITGAVTGNLEQSATIKNKDFGNLVLQIGANQFMDMVLELPEISSKALGIDALKDDGYMNLDNLQSSISICDGAIAKISLYRSSLGAYQNRLEHTVTSLDVTTENTSLALSRIVDTDMAKEMTNYTAKNIAVQAGMSIMAQANQRPQQVLQLIGNR